MEIGGKITRQSFSFSPKKVALAAQEQNSDLALSGGRPSLAMRRLVLDKEGSLDFFVFSIPDLCDLVSVSSVVLRIRLMLSWPVAEEVGSGDKPVEFPAYVGWRFGWLGFLMLLASRCPWP
ncbi:unnamed protein product [Arabis nemorensis]|uniref:Uncharacterized protein n=1 Tax=Arabis nemorensis TaxID=586526 RepID=A0A565CSD6_9BRAS|nr:unnamed protein product [Arabis nemorensis]